MLTKEQAVSAPEFHYGVCTRTVGPRGGVEIKITRVRRNGMTQVWKTRPADWRVPVKYGIRAKDQFSITQDRASEFHTPDDCPLAAEGVLV